MKKMDLKKWLNKYSVDSYGVHCRLFIIFGLFFLVPVFGFLYFALKYQFLSDNYIPLFSIVLLIFSLFGFVMLRKLFDQIVSISGNISKIVTGEFAQPQVSAASELKVIVDSFQILEREFRGNIYRLKKKTSDISILKELSDLCYMTFNQEELLYITLERALKLANADIGSVMMLEPKRDAFIIAACIGTGDLVKKGHRVSAANRIANYAVVNKMPLLVEDIETDIRFGRKSRPQYATKSFICMPLKTINDVIGVLTISSRKIDIIFTQEDVDILSPLISNAAITYDNLRLLKEAEIRSNQLQVLEKISAAINSNLGSKELLHTILQEIRETIPYDMAVIVELDEDNSNHVIITDFLSVVSTSLSRGNSHSSFGSVIDKVIKQQRLLIIEDTSALSQPVEKEIFLDHGFKTALLTPLKVDGLTTGVLVLCNVEMELLADMQNAIECMAGYLSLVIEKEKLSPPV